MALLANRRPLEGLLFCIPVAAGLLVWSLSRKAPPFPIVAIRIWLPLITVLLATGVFMGYYDWRVTMP